MVRVENVIDKKNNMVERHDIAKGGQVNQS